jgi:uncharacterized protein
MLYLDASALVKRYVLEDGSEELVEAMESADGWCACRICFVETVRAVALAGGRGAIKRVERDWLAFDVVEVDRQLAEQAARLTLTTELRSLDALHLASALMLPFEGLTVATWDVPLHRAAQEHRLETLPADLGG